jgi:hypothetical protein
MSQWNARSAVLFRRNTLSFLLKRVISKLAPNITQVVRTPLNDLRKKQISGFYRDVPVHPTQSESSGISKELEYLEGVHPSTIDYDCTLLECHVDLDLPGYEETGEDGEPTGIKIPYMVTISEDNGQVLSIRRNYQEDDPQKRKIQYFVHYKFLPGFGFYGLGLIHTIGGSVSHSYGGTASAY